MEHTECEAIQEVTRCEQSTDRAHRKAGATGKEVADIRQLRDGAGAVSTALDQHLEGVIKLVPCVTPCFAAHARLKTAPLGKRVLAAGERASHTPLSKSRVLPLCTARQGHALRT